MTYTLQIFITLALELSLQLGCAAGGSPLPGSSIIEKNICTTTYGYPESFLLDSCGRCVPNLSQYGLTCRCDSSTQPCVVCPDATNLVGLKLCRLDLGCVLPTSRLPRRIRKLSSCLILFVF
jgi:hypothetical protein